jgi:hypothetical protein
MRNCGNNKILQQLCSVLLLFTITSCAARKEATTAIAEPQMPRFPKERLLRDFDLLVNSLKEAHTGLYWYATEQQFDSMVSAQRLKITADLNTLEFYNIAAPVVAFTKEDHCDIHLSEAATVYLKEKGKFMPLTVVSLNQKVYLLNNPTPDVSIQGFELLEIDGRPIQEIYGRIFNTFAADGFILTSKYRELDRHKLAVEYAKIIAQPDAFELLVRNPETDEKQLLKVNAISSTELTQMAKTPEMQKMFKADLPPATLEFSDPETAILTCNTFSNPNYVAAGMNFKTFVQQAFAAIKDAGVKNLVIDIRENGGGTEGNEDYLFAYLTDKEYRKYKYVQASAFSYSFYKYTDCSRRADRKELEADLREEHEKSEDGRILRRPGIEQPEPVQADPFKGNVYVLTSGWTYSGGAEFSALMRSHTAAVFIGEETGGGYYGNTSGYSLELTLPNTGLQIDIPLLKFVLDVREIIPAGRGVLPDHEIGPSIQQFLEGTDAAMEWTKAWIEKDRAQ